MKVVYWNLRGTIRKLFDEALLQGKTIKHIELTRTEFDELQTQVPEKVLEPFTDAFNIVDGVRIVLENAPNRVDQGKGG